MPPPVKVRTRYALACVTAEPGRPDGRLLWLDGEEAGQVDLADPRRLAFPYMRRIADAIDAFRPRGAAVTAVFLGGGAFALPRYLAATRPGSRIEVHERDPGVVALAREHLGLRPGPLLRVRTGDAAELLPRRGDRSTDLVVCDAFDGPDVPAALAAPEFVAEVRRVLRPAGLYLLNVITTPPHDPLAEHLDALEAAFTHVAAIAPPKVLRHRAPGNAVLLGSAAPLPLVALRRAAQAAVPREQLSARALSAA